MHGDFCCPPFTIHALQQTTTLLVMLLQVQRLFKEYGFQHTNYAFVKNLTEALVASYHGKPFPVCISRPVSTGCIARSPAAGFVGNTSGAIGIILSLACGEHCYEGRQWEGYMPGLQTSAGKPLWPHHASLQSALRLLVLPWCGYTAGLSLLLLSGLEAADRTICCSQA